MTEIEKVIRGLECHKEGFYEDCLKCPYHDDGCETTLYNDALALLKTQVPRVMTVDEIKSDYVEIFYFETRAGMLRGCVKELSDLSGSSIVYLVCGSDDDTYWRDLDGYGITWRAWTRRPSFEQMTSTPWEGEKE